ncbi:MAG: indole-3-glycerol phosphate synthase TrpC [Spirochaetota bacterium]
MTVLEKIINNRRMLLEKEKQQVPEKKIRKKIDDLISSGYAPADFLCGRNINIPFLVAEIKKASPSRGLIREDFNIDEIAQAYKSSSYVNAISVLTEPDYFLGSYQYLKKAKDIAAKPLLMKDFIIDKYQIYKGFAEGASAVLFISAILTDSELEDLRKAALDLNLGILFETHTSSEYRRALDNNFNMIGINNRDLKTFVTDIHTTINIINSEGRPSDKLIISESGINSRDDVSLLRDSGADGFLIGERFMKQRDIEHAISEIFGDYGKIG